MEWKRNPSTRNRATTWTLDPKLPNNQGPKGPNSLNMVAEHEARLERFVIVNPEVCATIKHAITPIHVYPSLIQMSSEALT